MDAGIAALIGTAVGSAATLGAAMVTGRAQARSQHEHWRRQHRRDAYAHYLSALHDRDIALDAAREVLRRDPVDLTEVDEKIAAFIALAREVHRATEVVILEGPASLSAVIERVTHTSRDLSQTVRQMVDDARAGNSTRTAAASLLAAQREQALYQAVKDFRLAARNIVGNST
ncbi:proline dehydrogenase [Streptomyces kunmingensis]|uniref:Proline dehydrogenase n=1 Tax=Streptomyces kunmingensis TaxID=68225 RepID=A0ABU6CHU0_9ACTN|nr:proline dehydrogenase [Streptomyces kunmingensis]MEB3964286.1 proline dehydrogenase [Streptomyces kunmingensis]